MEPQTPTTPDPAPADPGPAPTPEPTIAEQFPRLAAKAAEVPFWKTPAYLAEYDAKTVDLVNAQMDLVLSAEAEHDEAKKAAADAKRKWEAEDGKLHGLIRERRENRGQPVQRTLLDLIPEAGDPPPDVGPVPDAPPGDPTENLWQQFPLARLVPFGVTDKDIEKLAEGRRKRGLTTVPLATVGDMARYTAGDPNSPGTRQELTDFDGIGPSVATRIDNALEQFWAWWGTAGRDEFAREMGVTRGPEQPGPAAAGDGGQDPGLGGNERAGEPAGDPAGDAGVPAADWGERPAVESGPVEPAGEPFVEPQDGPPIYDLDQQEGE